MRVPLVGLWEVVIVAFSDHVPLCAKSCDATDSAIPLLKILQTELRIPIVRAQETIDAVPADPEVAQRLGITVLYPVMHMRRVMFTTADRPFEVVETFYRADKYHYSVNLVRVKRKGKWTWKTEVETSRLAPPPR